MTDIADYALEAIRRSGIREVQILGRRGPAQASFTIPEIRKLGDLVNTETTTLPEEMELDSISEAMLERDREAARKVEIFREYSTRRQPERPKKMLIRFLVSPVEILGDERRQVKAVRLVKNELYQADTGEIRCRSSGRYELLETGLVLRSVGYKGIPLSDVPFDSDRGVIPNDRGRVLDPGTGDRVRGLYVSGWIKRCSTGVIGTNKADANETVGCMLEDIRNGASFHPSQPDPNAMDRLLRQRQVPDIISYPAWTRIDAMEVARGKPAGRPRVKFTRREDFSQVVQ